MAHNAEQDPGPVWWPTFGWRNGLIWFGQGFAIPVLVFLATVFVLTGINFLVGRASLSSAFQTGFVLSMWGFYVLGGSTTIAMLLHDGLRWRTALRISGVVAAIVFMFKVFAEYVWST